MNQVQLLAYFLVLQSNENGVFFPHVITKAVVNPDKYCRDVVYPHHPKPYSISYNDISDTLLMSGTYLTGILG